MLTLTYASTARQEFSDTNLLELLEQSRSCNLKFGITGLLLYRNGNFMQAIEGPKDAIRQLYVNIKADKRHAGVMTLLENETSERAFPEWNMAFKNLQDAKAEAIPGYSDFLRTSQPFSAFRDNPTQAQKLLLMFRDKMR